LILWDLKKYIQTKKKQYLTNIVLTVVFGIWALYPYYNSYVTWNDKEKSKLISHCEVETNSTICKCVDEAIFKQYSYEEYKQIDKNSTQYLEFLLEAKNECLGVDNGWF
jgi:hypothetical protein